MSYSVITSRRMPYDIDGTAMGYYDGNSFSGGVSTWITGDTLGDYNDEDLTGLVNWGYWGGGRAWWWFFPERREIEAMCVLVVNTAPTLILEGSNDTTNGMDGTWEAATFPNGNPGINCANDTDCWRTNIRTVSFSTSYKTIRLRAQFDRDGNEPVICGFHFYGRKATGETPDDIVLCDSEGNELTALTDWGDRPEGTTLIRSFKVKNASLTKIANNVNLQLNHADFGLSLSESGPWTATLDITSIAANSLSATIYVKNLLGPPLLTLGPKAARCIVKVGSFT